MNDFEDVAGSVFVSVYPSNLKDKEGDRIGGFIGKVKRKNISLEQLVLRAAQRNIPVSAETLLYAAKILSNEAKKALSEGFSVDLLGLGSLGVSVEGSLNSLATPSEVSEHLKLLFSPSKEAEKALSNIKPSKIVLKNSSIHISEVKSLSSPEPEPGVVYQNRPLCIRGNGLKVGGDVCGVFLVPCQEENVYAPRQEWISLPGPYTNTPKKLEVCLPDSFETGYDGEEGEAEPLFCVAVVTSLNPNSRKRAECVEAFSESFRVRKI